MKTPNKKITNKTTPTTPEKSPTSWGHVAGWYDTLLSESPDSYQEKVIMPNILRLVEPKHGLMLLDVACGQGHFSRAFEKNGATVTSFDISKELIDIAKKNSPKEITYFVASAEQFSTSKEISALVKAGNLFDVVTIVLAIQNIESVRAVFSECAKVLKPGGRIVMVLNHPAFRIPQHSSWQWNEKTMAQYRRIDAYMSDERTRIDMNPGASEKAQGAGLTTLSFHRPLQSYFKALAATGFAVTRLEEWISHKTSQKGPRAEEEDRIRKEIPMFMCLEARKG